MKSLVIALVLLFTSPAFSDDCSHMFAFGKPQVSSTELVTYLCRRLYAVEHSPSRHTPYWSAERLVGKNLTMQEPRVDSFKADPTLPYSETAKPSDYYRTNYDKGHMAPVGDMHSDQTAMLESFYMSNIVPQKPGNNRIGWRLIELFVRELAMSRGELFVITGPAYLGQPKTIGKTKVAIPTHLFKVVYDPAKNVSMTFLVLNDTLYEKDIAGSLSTLSQVEKLTGVKFFPTATTPITESSRLWTSKSD